MVVVAIIVAIMPVEIDPEDGAIGAARLQERVFSSDGVGVAGGIEEEGPEVATRAARPCSPDA